MAADSDKKRRTGSASSVKRSATDGAQLQILSPEGSSVYMTELSSDSWHDDHRHSNPITNKTGTTLIGVPRRTTTTTSLSDTPPLVCNHGNGHNTDIGLGDELTNQLSELAVATVIDEQPGEVGSSSSVSSDSSDEEGEGEGVLERAGVEGIDLDNVQAGPDGKAPIELVSQFVTCLMRNEYEAAKVLCEKVIELEPVNETAAQFYPLLEERIQLDNDLPTESSSSESEEEEEDSGDESSESSSSSESSEKDGAIADNKDVISGANAPAAQVTHTHKHCTHSSTTWQP